MELNYNRVELRGTVDDAPVLSHINHGCAFYRFTLSVLRLSGQADKLPVIAPKSLLLLTPLTPGDTVHITGQLRSFNNKSGLGSRLVISVFAQTLAPDAGQPLNRIFLSGILCKQPILRRTPLGREICDMILAEPPLRTGGLSALHRVGRCGAADGAAAHRTAADGGGSRPEPHLLQDGRRRYQRPHRL